MSINMENFSQFQQYSHYSNKINNASYNHQQAPSSLKGDTFTFLDGGRTTMYEQFGSVSTRQSSDTS